MARKILTLLLLSSSFVAQGKGILRGTVSLSTVGGEKIADASDAIVFVEGAFEKESATEVRASMSSLEKQFVPKVLPIPVGASVDFPNEDRILHNVFSLSKVQSFDLGLYKKGEKKSVQFKQPGLVKVYCNIHEKMVGYVLVLENSFFSRANKEGSFQIGDLPIGKHRVTAWHWSGSPETKEVVITNEGKVVDFKLQKQGEIAFNLLPSNPTEKHKNK